MGQDLSGSLTPVLLLPEHFHQHHSMRKLLLTIPVLIVFGCIYKAGNRVMNLDLHLETNINVFFIRREAINEVNKLTFPIIRTSEEITFLMLFFQSLIRMKNELIVLSTWISERIVFWQKIMISLFTPCMMVS